MANENISSCCKANITMVATSKNKTIHSLREELKHRNDIVSQEVSYKLSDRAKLDKARKMLIDTKWLQLFDEKTIKAFKKIFGEI